jgi:hypothetical protein
MSARIGNPISVRRVALFRKVRVLSFVTSDRAVVWASKERVEK